MQEIKQSYFNLLMIASSIRSFWISKVAVESLLNQITSDDGDWDYDPKFLSETIDHFNQQAMAIKGFLTIQTCSFLDEYAILHKILPSDPSLADEAIEFKKGLKKLMKPTITMISNTWKDLREVRNNFFAHNWRKNSTLIMFSSVIEKPSNSPWIDEEFTLLVGIFDVIIDKLKKYAPSIYIEMNDLILANNSKKVHHMSRVKTHDESLELISALKTVMDYELSKLNAK